MAATFIADLKDLVARFAQTVDGRATGRKEQALAQSGIAAALSSGLHAARALDIIVANQCRGDAEALAAWELDRKIALPRRPRSRSQPAAAGAVPAAGPQALAPTPEARPAPAAEGQGPAPSEAGVPVRIAS
jgi:hypothetical protein